MMDDDDLHESRTSSNPRYRSPVYHKKEVKLLLDLISEFKTIILNKSTTADACHAKELTWAKITKRFNSHGFKITRTTDGLKHKWKNLITNVKRQSKHLIDADHDGFDEFTSQILSLMYEDINKSEIMLPADFEDDIKDITPQQQDGDKNEFWDDKEQEDSEDDIKVVRNRSVNFTAEEIKLLLQCVQAEKIYVYYKGNTKKACIIKNLAWSRIAQAYNKRSPQKRSKLVLHRKFVNIKNSGKKINCTKDAKHVNLFDENSIKDIQEIKTEPNFELEELSKDVDDDLDSVEFKERDVDTAREGNLDPDPLSTILGNSSSPDRIFRTTRNRCLNFSSEECELLLKCVRAEKNCIMSKGTTVLDNKLKNKAWSRVTNEFNKQSSQKRSKRMLHTKFFNMKKGAKRGKLTRMFENNSNKETKHVSLFDENSIDEKSDLIGHEHEMNVDDDKTDSDDDFAAEEVSSVRADPDPLTMVLNSDSGLGSSVNIDSFNPFENNQVVKLKMDLLKRKIENAELKKKRIVSAIEKEMSAYQLGAIEKSLRLRTARLEAIAAEMKLPPNHPALAYTASEAAAQTYLNQFST